MNSAAAPRPAWLEVPAPPAQEPDWLTRLHSHGQALVRQHGLPTPQDEAWKYTNLSSLLATPLTPARPGPVALDISTVPTLWPTPDHAHRLVFVDGRLWVDLCRLDDVPAGVLIGDLAQTLAAGIVPLSQQIGQLAAVDSHPLIALNTAGFRDGAVLWLPPETILTRPVEVVWLATAIADATPTLWHPRVLVVAGANSEATLIEHHVGCGDGIYYANGTTEIALDAGARLRHYKIQQESVNGFHTATGVVRVERGASYESFVLMQGGRMARHEQRVDLVGAEASAKVSGAYLVRGRQHSDITTVITHQQPHGTSRQMCKGVIDDHARAVFQGRITVQPGAQKTDGRQTHRALLLSPHAEIDAKPELEIYADDVKCSHGATAGEIDDDALFFLRARGIDLETARGLLVAAFVSETLDEIQNETVREGMRARIESWLHAASAARADARAQEERA